MTGRKGALTTYYPEQMRADYAAGNRGRHVLTLRADGSGKPQCIACNMCATVCPAKVIEIDAAMDFDDPERPKYPARFELDYSRCIFCGLCVEACPEDAIRMVKDVPNLPGQDRSRMWASKEDLMNWKPQADPAKRYPGDSPVPSREALTMNELLAGLESLLLYVFAFAALVGSILVVVLRQPMRVAMALISTMIFSAAFTDCSACTSSPRSRC
jgi:NADH-quinone oxidoreductase subunit I